MVNYDCYRVFYYVGFYKNLTKAASVLCTSQPAVTRTIKKLEAELGCLLFVRGKNGVEFTYEGDILYGYVSNAHNQILKGEEQVNRAISIESGTVYIGATVTALQEVLFRKLDDFHRKYPKIKLRISTSSTNGVIEKLKNGLIDLGFVSTPCDSAKTLKLTAIRQFRDILIAGTDYADIRDRTLTAQELTGYPLVCLRKNMQLREFIDLYFAERNLVISPDIELDSADLIVPMVSHNFGLGFVPQNMAEEAISKGEIFPLKLAEDLPPRKICMISNTHFPHTRIATELSRFIVGNT